MAHHALRLLLAPVVATAILAGCADRPEEALGDDLPPMGPIDDPGPMDPGPSEADDGMGASDDAGDMTNQTGDMPNGTIDPSAIDPSAMDPGMMDDGAMLPSAP